MKVFQKYLFDVKMAAGPEEDKNGVEDTGAMAPGTEPSPYSQTVSHQL